HRQRGEERVEAGFLKRGVMHDVVRVNRRKSGGDDRGTAAEQLASDQRGAKHRSGPDERLPKQDGYKRLLAERDRRKEKRVERDAISRWRASIKGKSIPGRNVVGEFEEEPVAIGPEVGLAR